jgi:putative ATP-dependent endonuclease of the OLD family
MKIATITLQGFRCFGHQPTTIRLSDGITALVGANGTGKTALLEGLVRVFGVTREQRTIRRSDFYMPPGHPVDDRSERKLYIDTYLVFPELEAEDDLTNTHTAVPEHFKHFLVSEPGGKPFVRLRLEAIWKDDQTVDGEVEQKLFWVITDDESPSEKDITPCSSHDRGLIQVHYVPAARDPSSQLTYATTAMAGQLLRDITWSPETKSIVQEASEQVRGAFSNEVVIQTFNEFLTERWSTLHDDSIDTDPEFNIASKRLEEEIRRVCVMFRPTELGEQRELDELSDGQKSLFYFSLVAAVFDLKNKLIQQSAHNISNGLKLNHFQAPVLTIFAFEEPENHLAPYFLARIIQQIRSLVTSQSTQALLSSHSSAVLGRINPPEVRHFQLNPELRCARVNEIKLPDSEEEVAKYIQEAVSAYPELYFARFVILGEGDSEQVVIPRLASAMGLEVDRSFVAIVPLGGRHVNHFWRLLCDLDIPYATLLDLDTGRKGAGWGRIKYVCKQLLKVGVSPEKLLKFQDGSSNEIEISEDQLENLHTRNEQDIELESWISHLETFNVFFSQPLDLDMAMLSQFPEIYKSIVPPGFGSKFPAISSQKYRSYLDAAGKAVLGEDADLLTYPDNLQRLFPWYRYLFLQKSKPSTHLQALSQIDNSEFKLDAPPVLLRLLDSVNQKLRPNKK